MASHIVSTSSGGTGNSSAGRPATSPFQQLPTIRPHQRFTAKFPGTKTWHWFGGSWDF
ncbi:hypothetical protein FRUB_07619 [Fimbriiglobus ruber]|uniref:Uncharacterized protein n=1 Tax=Fimbriiglobus ruber TaxID=1908690 RepID=A0A225DMP2_9BACT|nr:hypothetical protein FRUB_07619 [Fimbriiglobus ruber]